MILIFLCSLIISMLDYKDEKLIRNQDLFHVPREQMNSLIHRSIGAITFLTPEKHLGVGSGVAISRDLVLTVAHNIYDQKYKHQNDSFKFYLKDGDVVEKYYEIESWQYLPEFTDCPPETRIQFDYALLKLRTPLPFDEYVPLTQVCEHCLMEMNYQTILQIFGFPGKYGDNYRALDRFGESFILEKYGLARKGRILSIHPELFTIAYAMGTLNGLSGAPAWIQGKVIAVHCGSGNEGEQLNVGRLITSDLLINLQIWREQLNGSPFQTKSTRFCPFSEKKLTTKDLQDFINSDQSLKYQQIKRLLLEKDQIIKKLQLFLNESNETNSYLQQENKMLSQAIEELRQRHNASGLRTSIQFEQKLQLSQAKTQENSPFSQQQQYSNSSDSSFDFEQEQLVSDYSPQYQIEIPAEIVDILNESKTSERLDINEQSLSYIDVSQHFKLKTLSLFDNQLSVLDLRHNINLVVLALDSNRISQINLHKNTLLVHINLSNNRLERIDLINCRKLKTIQLQNNALNKVRLYWTSQFAKFNLQNQESYSCKVCLIHQEKEKKCVVWEKILQNLTIGTIIEISMVVGILFRQKTQIDVIYDNNCLENYRTRQNCLRFIVFILNIYFKLKIYI